MGRKKDIESPEQLWQFFEEYKGEVKGKPYLKHQIKTNKDGLIDAYVQMEQPLIMEGFENFVADKGFCQAGLGHYFSNLNNSYEEFLAICARIRREIHADHKKGAMLELYNPAVTARINGWADKQESTVRTEQPLFPDVTE